MAITSKPKPKPAEPVLVDNAAADAFISGAPDASKAQATRREVKKLISLKIAPTLLERVDQQALAEAARAAEKVVLAFVDQAQDVRRFIDVVTAIFAQPGKGLDANGQLAAGQGGGDGVAHAGYCGSALWRQCRHDLCFP